MNTNNQTPAPQDRLSAKSSTGLDENLAALLSYLGTFVTGIIFLVIEKNSSFVRFHAMQSIVIFVGLGIISFGVDGIPFIGWLLDLAISFLMLILWVVLMVKAYQKEWFKVPVASIIAEKLVEKFNDSSGKR